MSERTKSTRVEFYDETICDYTNTKFKENTLKCNKYQTFELYLQFRF